MMVLSSPRSTRVTHNFCVVPLSFVTIILLAAGIANDADEAPSSAAVAAGGAGII